VCRSCWAARAMENCLIGMLLSTTSFFKIVCSARVVLRKEKKMFTLHPRHQSPSTWDNKGRYSPTKCGLATRLAWHERARRDQIFSANPAVETHCCENPIIPLTPKTQSHQDWQGVESLALWLQHQFASSKPRVDESVMCRRRHTLPSTTTEGVSYFHWQRL
jgi:hypothetical protein